MKILITGAGSFIGNAARAHFEKCGGFEAHMISLRGDDWKKADISGYDCALHCAGIAHVPYTDAMDEKYMAVNRDLTLEFAKKAKESGIGHFVFLSSMIVYGQAERAGRTRIVTRETEPTPENAYGLSKLEAENGLFAMADENFRVAAIRVPTVYGKGCKGAYSTLSRHGDKLAVFPKCPGVRSVIYVENLAEFLRRVILERGSGIFWPQDRDYVSTADFVREIRAARGKKTIITGIFAPFIALVSGLGPMRKIFGGIAYEKSMSECGWDYRLCTLSQAVRRTEEG